MDLVGKRCGRSLACQIWPFLAKNFVRYYNIVTNNLLCAHEQKEKITNCHRASPRAAAASAAKLPPRCRRAATTTAAAAFAFIFIIVIVAVIIAVLIAVAIGTFS